MKAESSDTPATPATTTTTTTAPAGAQQPTPTPTHATTQWEIPIDPALQQQSVYQHYQTYAGHYPTAAYPSHYQAYAPPQRPATSTATTTSTTAGNTAGSTGAGNTDIAVLKDALGSAGVDLRAEEESLQRTHGDTQHQHQPFRLYDDRSRKQPPTPNFDTRFLSQTIRTLSTPHKITRIPDDSINYLALALRTRLQDLLTSMIVAAKHRSSTQFDRPASQYTDEKPMWSIVVRSDVAKQLAAIERAEREEETRIRRERKERADLAAAHAAALAAQANAAGVPGFTGLSPGAAATATGIGEDEYEGGTKKKRKKDGPGVTARNMSEDVRKKMSNAVATQAAGLGGRYAWMNAANLSSPIPPKPKPVATTTSTTTTTTTTTTSSTTADTVTMAGATTTSTTTTAATTTTTPPSTLTSSWATPYISTKPKQSQPSQDEADTRLAITMRDAMFVIEKERGHGAGRGSARGWAY